MKLFYFHIVGEKDSVYSKVKNHFKVFNKYVDEGKLEKFSGVIPKIRNGEKILTLEDGTEIKFFGNHGRISVLQNLLIAYPKIYKEVIRYIKENGYSHIYIRRAACDSNFIKFVKNLKENRITILYEIPTYPYDKEFPANSLMIKKDQKYRMKLSKYVKYVITPSPGFNKIFDIPVKWIPNGIDVSTVKPLKISKKHTDDTINLIAVAGLSEWHAYERLIKGMYQYNSTSGTRKIVFHMVGGDSDNKYRKMYEALADQYGLNDNVIFYGNLYGDKLDEVYDKADIGVGSLGVHRLGIEIMTTLKSREYYAKGLPMICEGTVDIIPKDHKYLYSVSLDEEPIKINELVEFYDRVYPKDTSNEKIIKELREFANEKCDMSKLMLPILAL